MFVGTSPSNSLELRFKLLNLDKELNCFFTLPLRELKEKSRTSSWRKPEKSPSCPANWLLLKLSACNLAFKGQGGNWPGKLVKLFLERSRYCKVSSEHMEARRIVELERPNPDRESWVTAADEPEWLDTEQVTPLHKHGLELVVFHLLARDGVAMVETMLERFLMMLSCALLSRGECAVAMDTSKNKNKRNSSSSINNTWYEHEPPYLLFSIVTSLPLLLSSLQLW